MDNYQWVLTPRSGIRPLHTPSAKEPPCPHRPPAQPPRRSLSPQAHGRSTPSTPAWSSRSNTSASPPSRASSRSSRARLEVGPDGAVAYGTVKTTSVDTREPQRDEHLRSADFFEVEKYPEIGFRSTAIRATGEDEFEIDADLSIHGITRPVTLKATLEGYEPEDHQGNTRVGISASTQINRSDFEMRFNAALGSGNMVVSDKVKILVEVSAVKAD